MAATSRATDARPRGLRVLLAAVLAIAAGCTSEDRPLPTLLPAPVLPERGRVVDLTHPLAEGVPVFPGGVPFTSDPLASIDKDGYFACRLSLGEHTGTHVDAPRHFVADAADVAGIAPERLLAAAVVIDVSARAATDADTMVSVADIAAFEAAHGAIPRGAVVLMRSGWDRYWDEPELYVNRAPDGQVHFPGFSPEAADFLVRERDVFGLGVDTLSIDTGIASGFEAHHVLLAAGGIAIENLTRLDRLPPEGATLIIAPLPIVGGSGGPARVFAVVP